MRVDGNTIGRSSVRRWRRVVLGLFVSLCAVAGCGLQSANQFVPEAEPGSIEPIESLQGVPLSVGSKEFTEQLILGKIAVIALTVAGADITDRTNIAGSVATRRALESGEIDAYWEYTGTAWLSYLGHSRGYAEAQRQWKAVHDADRRNDIVWLEPTPLNNSFTIVTPRETSRRLDATTLSDLADVDPSERTFCLSPEFASREDGFEPMLEHYGMTYGEDVPRANVELMDIGVIFAAVDRGRLCNFGVANGTDGRILTLDLVVLEDDEGYFPKYNVAFNLRAEVIEAHPEIRDVIAPITEALTTETMQELNTRVDRDGIDPAIVARDWMVEKGFVN